MRIGLRILKPSTVQWLEEALRLGQLSRHGLARELCEWEDWRNPQGRLCLVSARKALPKLAQGLGLDLPAARRPPPPAARAAGPPPPTRFEGPLSELGGVRLEAVTTRAQRGEWRAMLAAFHDRGPASAPGCRLTYRLVSARHGVLGGLSFVAAPMRLGPRDRAIGWSDRARGANLAQVVHQDRFLLLPAVRVKNLASHALARATRRLAADWSRQHGARPLLAETCVGPRYAGTCYRAAGWQAAAGETGGAPPGARRAREPKRVFLRPLAAHWRERLRREPPRRALGSFPEPALDAQASWAEREFARSDLPDGRLRRRLQALGAGWENACGKPLTDVFPDRAGQVAAYRFLRNPRVSVEDILQPHREALAERARLHSTVLVVQDTTALNYTSLQSSTTGLGSLGSRGSGLWAHAAVAFSESGRALGVAGLEVWARPVKSKSGREESEQSAAEGAESERQAVERKESERWFRGFERAAELGRACAKARVISVCDREGDIYALFQRQAQVAGEAGLLTRANGGRQRQARPAGSRKKWRALRQCVRDAKPLVTGRKVAIRDRGGRQKRTARTEVRSVRLALRPPREHRGAEPLAVWVTEVSEPGPPPGAKALDWLLVSSEGAATAEAALRTVRQYELRWGVEEYFRLMKTSARVEDRRLGDAASLARCLAFDAIECCRIFDLQRLARVEPSKPAAEVLEPTDLECLRVWLARRPELRPPRERGEPLPQGIGGVVVLVARLAGFIPSKRQPLPGNEIVWRGYKKLRLLAQGMEALLAFQEAR